MTEVIRCRKCAHINPHDAVFCAQCDETLRWFGDRITVDDPPPEPARPVPVRPPPPRSANPDAVVTPTDPPAPSRPPDIVAPVVRTPRQPSVGEVVCAHCATPNAVGLTFCSSCGEELPQSAPATPRLSLADQLKAGAVDGEDTLPGRGAARWWFAVAAIVLLGGGGFALFGPPQLWERIVHETEDSVERIRGEGGVSVGRPEVVETAPALGNRLDDYADPGELVDGDKTSAWATSWAAPAAGQAESTETECAAPDLPAAGPGGDLVFTWTTPRDIERVHVVGGLAADSPSVNEYRRPTVIELTTDAGTCVRRELAGDPGGDDVKFRFTGVTSVSLRIIAVSDLDAPGPFVALREVKFVG